MRDDQGPADDDRKERAPQIPLCREPWQNYYILRRGIQPCCHGHAVIAPMSAWRTAWNSNAMQEMRAYLARGELSPYCLRSLSCPIVQRHLGEERLMALVNSPPPKPPPPPPAVLRALNRILFRLPGRIYRRLQQNK